MLLRMLPLRATPPRRYAIDFRHSWRRRYCHADAMLPLAQRRLRRLLGAR